MMKQILTPTSHHSQILTVWVTEVSKESKAEKHLEVNIDVCKCGGGKDCLGKKCKRNVPQNRGKKGVLEFRRNLAVCSCKVSLRKEKGKSLAGRKIPPGYIHLTGLETAVRIVVV